MKPSHLVPVLALALAFPAVALAAGGGDGEGRESRPDASAVAGLQPLQRSAQRFDDVVASAAERIEADRLAALRRRAREEREAFERLPGGVSIETLTAIAECESGGDPTIVSASGAYRGKYQFSVSTWESVGGSGDPAAAPEHEQDYRAALLYARSGPSPWPVCG